MSLRVATVDRAKLSSIIRKSVSSRIPGYLEALEAHCRKMFGKSCIDLFLDEPEDFRAVLFTRYNNDVNPVYFAIKYLFLRAILIALDMLELEEELARDFIENPLLFKEKFHKILKI
uniref:Uncharacterized protein n=1 Tax=Ignisphaera aggregans TaxID=334771 RepID=A0A7C4BE37_9CREN